MNQLNVQWPHLKRAACLSGPQECHYCLEGAQAHQFGGNVQKEIPLIQVMSAAINLV